MHKVKYFLFIGIMSILGISSIKANTINSIDINVYIDNSGNAHIMEKWDMNVNKGTEVYKPMYNLGDRNISNFTVKDETSTTYTDIPWNVNKSLGEKKYKSGINYTNKGKELCWGMGSYGHHTYTINYNLSNVITSYSDSQATLWKLVNESMDPAPNKVTIDIRSYYYFPDTLDVWGYGYKGYAYVKDGIIHMETESGINSDEYMVLLAKFPENTFKTQLTDSKSFDELHTQAEKGSFKHNYDTNVGIKILSFIITLIFTIIPFAIIMFIFKCCKSGVYLDSNAYYFGENEKFNKKEAGYFRDIPCNKDIFRAYFISQICNINKNKTDFLGAILLKWLKEKQIKIITQEKNKLFGGTKQEYSIDLTKEYEGNNVLEKRLYIMLQAASNDNYLENKEFEKWCKSNYSKIFKWFDDVIYNENKRLQNEGKIYKTEKTTLKIFKSTLYKVDISLKQEAINLQGLKNFLNDFTLIKDREAIEVTMFEEYLMYAQMFGIAKKVAEQFKKIYPEFIEQNPEFNYDSFLILNSISSSGISSANSARSAAQSYSSGGGGFSSGGGGGGSFGGGGGGCR